MNKALNASIKCALRSKFQKSKIFSFMKNVHKNKEKTSLLCKISCVFVGDPYGAFATLKENALRFPNPIDEALKAFKIKAFSAYCPNAVQKNNRDDFSKETRSTYS